MGCARTNELIKFLLHQKQIPKLELNYPKNEEEGVKFVAAIKRFLTSLGASK
jgi:putative methanogenesis marker protein 5